MMLDNVNVAPTLPLLVLSLCTKDSIVIWLTQKSTSASGM